MQPEAQPGAVALLAEIGFVQPLPGRIRRGNLGEIRARPSQQVFHFADPRVCSTGDGSAAIATPVQGSNVRQVINSSRARIMQKCLIGAVMASKVPAN